MSATNYVSSLVASPPSAGGPGDPFVAQADSLLSPDGIVGGYTHYFHTSHYVKDLGLCVVPLAQASYAPPQVIQTHQPVQFKVVNWMARRRVLPPIVPDSMPTNANLVLVREEELVNDCKIDSSGGAHLFTIAGRYVYLCLQPYTTATGFPAGVGPYDGSPAADLVFGASQFSDQLLVDGIPIPGSKVSVLPT